MVKKQVFNHCKKVVTNLKYFPVNNNKQYFIVQGTMDIKGPGKTSYLGG